MLYADGLRIFLFLYFYLLYCFVYVRITVSTSYFYFQTRNKSKKVTKTNINTNSNTKSAELQDPSVLHSPGALLPFRNPTFSYFCSYNQSPCIGYCSYSVYGKPHLRATFWYVIRHSKTSKRGRRWTTTFWLKLHWEIGEQKNNLR